MLKELDCYFSHNLLYKITNILVTSGLYSYKGNSYLYILNNKINKNLSQNDLGFAWRRPTLTGTRSQLPSALESLTSVFGMGTGVTSLPSSPNYEGIFLQN